MASPSLIFIGSSSEALPVARLVARVVRDAGLTPLIWEDVFGPGDIPLQRIEQLPNEICGAVLVTTPDELSKRGKKKVRVPVTNIIFEYGYLAARLTLKRVALCEFEGVTNPSDLNGLTVVRVKSYTYDSSNQKPGPLPKSVTARLRDWLRGLPPLAEDIPPAHRLHGYSGTWKIQTRFSLWHEYKLKADDQVIVNGTMFLLLPVEGQNGSGSMTGTTEVLLDHRRYSALYAFDNDVVQADVDKHGILSLKVRVVSRSRITEDGKLPKKLQHLGDKLLGAGNFKVELKPKPRTSRTLTGLHTYSPGIKAYSTAVEEYTYSGFTFRR